jgi:hypothetical protein
MALAGVVVLGALYLLALSYDSWIWRSFKGVSTIVVRNDADSAVTDVRLKMARAGSPSMLRVFPIIEPRHSERVIVRASEVYFHELSFVLGDHRFRFVEGLEVTQVEVLVISMHADGTVDVQYE